MWEKPRIQQGSTITTLCGGGLRSQVVPRLPCWRVGSLYRVTKQRLQFVLSLSFRSIIFPETPPREYFADGMTDELITMLAKDSTLRVVSRTSVMQYKALAARCPKLPERWASTASWKARSPGRAGKFT